LGFSVVERFVTQSPENIDNNVALVETDQIPEEYYPNVASKINSFTTLYVYIVEASYDFDAI
jgi:hypothetical protein